MVSMEITINEAFDIEKQSSKNWNLFLYDLLFKFCPTNKSAERNLSMINEVDRSI